MPTVLLERIRSERVRNFVPFTGRFEREHVEALRKAAKDNATTTCALVRIAVERFVEELSRATSAGAPSPEAQESQR
ncbi:MAG: hypothetical protein JNJ88_18200 [Planctomycetes bacterium]|nr:hypothetical protein [Planctomycetota bacterium]